MAQNVKNLVQRTILPKVIKHLEAPEITIITGSRQVGKTTLLFQLKDYLLKKGVPENNILIFNLDILSELELFTSQANFIKFLKERIGKGRLFVFVDEAQRVKNAGIFFKGIYDLNLPLKLVLTGSSSLEIRAKIHESLTGRKRIFHLYPFSFQEYLSAKDKTLEKLISKKEISPYSQKLLQENLLDFIIWGGYPRVALETNIEEKYQILKEIHSSYFDKDIIGFLKIREPITFTKFLNLLANQIGQLVNFYELSNTLGITYRTAEKYLNILEKTFILNRVTPFFKNYRKELTKMPKIYFFDTGIRDFAINSFKNFEERTDKGQLLENFIFSEISKQTDIKIHFWRTKDKAEVDFVLINHLGEILPVEIKATSLKTGEISRSFRSFIERYRPRQAIVVNFGFHGEMKLNKTQIVFIYPYEIERIINL
ncbi:ATPase [Candidatus Falkowbacteria bacterium CG_4_9_14_3_um_filter_38_19]|uniref:ATPase n=1 Tax=Candidatus Falkowbacteria bacterium CG_4_9_14_3_um_filter_38_19 TaxID=1974559 RepID=A0A2M8AEX0_9BACT|nr:MAG: ATPase [Candidatus Falkowbacteria bacterium CG_4_9_14_3_um_filter_38_19]